jgi:hypothetical protein
MNRALALTRLMNRELALTRLMNRELALTRLMKLQARMAGDGGVSTGVDAQASQRGLYGGIFAGWRSNRVGQLG